MKTVYLDFKELFLLLRRLIESRFVDNSDFKRFLSNLTNFFTFKEKTA